jgi:hypothetical protein
VDGFIDRLADFLRSVLGDDEQAQNGANRTRPAGGTRYADPDLQEAWEELDDYMRTGTERERRKEQARDSSQARRPADEALRRDYATLEVPFGSDIETVRASYKRLILLHHPDRQGGDPERQKAALETTKRINESFERIRSRQESPRG